MEVAANYREAAQLQLRYDGTFGVQAAIKPSPYAQSRSCTRVANEVDDRFQGSERLPSPVLCDMTEEPVLNLVPLARAGREVADDDIEARVVGEPLKLKLPSVRPIAIAT